MNGFHYVISPNRLRGGETIPRILRTGKQQRKLSTFQAVKGCNSLSVLTLTVSPLSGLYEQRKVLGRAYIPDGKSASLLLFYYDTFLE